MSDRLVLYTAIFGGKDAYQEPPDGDYDKVLFTDQGPSQVRSARVLIVKPTNDPRRLARFYKIASHVVLPDADCTMWMDGLIETRDVEPRLFCMTHLAHDDIAAHHNLEANGVYAAAIKCLRAKVDNPDVIVDQMNRYIDEGYPDNLGLVETGIVLRRHTPAVAAFNDLWAKELDNGSIRDQLSFNYSVWRTGVRFRYIPGSLVRNEKDPGFCVGGHLVEATPWKP